MNPAVAQALCDWRILNQSGHWWAAFESRVFDTNLLVVKLEYGVIHSNGQKECTLRTAYYHINASGEVEVS